MSDLSPAKVKPLVLILWADCYQQALALKVQLSNEFKDRALFFDILDDGTESEYQKKSTEAITKANRVLVLVEESVWKNNKSLNVRNEVNLVEKRIRHGDLAESALSFVRYQRWKIPEWYSGHHPLSFASEDSLNPSEVTAFDQWLFQEFKKLPRIQKPVYERPEFEYLLLNWLITFDKTIWLPPIAPQVAKWKQDILSKLGFLKHLHSVHAKPGPEIDALAATFPQVALSEARTNITDEVWTLRDNLILELGRGREAQQILSSVKQLVEMGLLPLLSGLQRRIAENVAVTPGPSKSAVRFLADLLPRLKLICDSQAAIANKPILEEAWSRGFKDCLNLITDPSRGIFLAPEDVTEWESKPENRCWELFTNVQELHERSLYIAVAIVVFFNLLHLQSPVGEDSARDNGEAAQLQRVLKMFADLIKHKRVNSRLSDPVVKKSNALILNYISAAEKLVENV